MEKKDQDRKHFSIPHKLNIIEASEELALYVVQPGDTVGKIAFRHNMRYKL